MKTAIRSGALFLGVLLVAVTTSLATAQDKIVRAKVGIQVKSGDQTAQAKTTDRLKAGDEFRIYVRPEEGSYVYVVRTDQKRATLLNNTTLLMKRGPGQLLVLPSAEKFYQLDRSSSRESITIICSPTPLRDVVTLLRSEEVSHAKWMTIEEALIEKSKIDLSGKSEKPFGLSGTVRPGTRGENEDPFLNELQVFSGKSLVVKRYEFTVK